MKQELIILAIETSCDDTCVSIIKASGEKKPVFKVLSNIVSSQIKIHRKYGGVYPMLAKREHQRNLLPVLIQALKESKLLKISNFQFPISNKFPMTKFPKPDIDLIAVTIGPGLEPCLWVGVNFAKDLSSQWNIPLVPVNHIEAHILVNFQFSIFNFQNIFPAIALVVSGGHTQLILMKNIGEYKILGETRDDAAGECFDKTAKILKLGYPGGPIISEEAKKHNGPTTIKLPRPMIFTKDYDFSFSGLKTAVLYNFKNQPEKIQKNKQYIKEMSKEVQQAIIDVLIKKTIKAAKDFNAKTIILGGGVSANDELREQLKNKIKKDLPNTKYLVPDIKYSTDNAVMTGITGYFNWLRNKTTHWKKIEVNANLRLE